MAATAEDRHEEDLDYETYRVVAWRFERLYQAGYDLPDARIIARCTDIDLHYAVDIFAKTADSALARRLVL